MVALTADLHKTFGKLLKLNFRIRVLNYRAASVSAPHAGGEIPEGASDSTHVSVEFFDFADAVR